ncbi:hypothetical protein [Mycoavidus cysteinexigens]|uniref:hypothetical protein n=1 Tax=Mycoavidus cysteinexigens TaxID=1553431 RepID=UPI001375A942|nr:hypothetical protein [Mycoavidus cysteinexigens]
MNRPKVLGLNQNGTRLGLVAQSSANMDKQPPAKKRDPTRTEIQAEQDKPVTLPEMVGKPRGMLLALRVQEGAKSEGRLVMRGIKSETFSGAKASRLALGQSGQEILANRYTRESR